MKKLISLLLLISLIFTFVSCGEYNPPIDEGPAEKEEEKEDNNNTGNGDGGTAERGEPFTVTVTLNGKVYTPPTVSDNSLAVKVRWTDGKSYSTVDLGENGKAVCYGLDGEYHISLINLPDIYTYNPNVYIATNDNREVVIELLKLSYGVGEGTDPYNCIHVSGTGVYRAEIKKNSQEIFYEFEPKRAGTYRIESIVDISAEMYNPYIDVYTGSFASKYRDKRIDGGGVSGSYTTNFRYVVNIDEKFIGNVFTFAVMLEGKDATYPTYVDFIISYEGDYSYDWITSSFVYPSFIGESFNYSEYAAYLSADRAKFGDRDFSIASVKVDGKNVFDQQYFRLNSDDGFYHVYDEVKYAAYGGWGPILYANITVATLFIDQPFNLIESMGNKNLTLSSGTENYKLFIEGYGALIGNGVSYFCLQDCPCIESNGGCCPTEKNCTKCTEDCRHIPAKYIGQMGYSDIAIEGRCPVTEELKDFLQKYSVSQKLFSDGNGWAEQKTPRYDAYEDSQWLFACGYYTN